MQKIHLQAIFNIEDILDLPKAIMKLLNGDLETRNDSYKRLIELNNYDMSYDWFQKIYEEDFAQRKQNKQDFTPNQVSKLASLITGNNSGWIYEPTAGNGSMIITDWWQRCLRSSFPIMHFPSQNLVQCVELSDRAIPILLLNLSIRGIMGYVYHGDVITQELKCKYILLNRNDDTLSFSEIIKDTENNKWLQEIAGEKKLLKSNLKFF